MSLLKCHKPRSDNTRIDPAVIRNAGGRVSDALRTIAVMQVIAEPSWIVVLHHTGTTHPSYFSFFPFFLPTYFPLSLSIERIMLKQSDRLRHDALPRPRRSRLAARDRSF
jgi:hypothetical protein